MANNRRILVIDDNAEIHEDFCRILGGDDSDCTALGMLEEEILGRTPHCISSERFEIDFAPQGEMGLERVKQSIENSEPYALVFVDVRMPPGWDGVETIKYLWRVDPHLQAVIITAYSDYNWQDIIERLGITDQLLILKKPFESIEISQLAVALCTKWDMANQLKQHTDELLREREKYIDLYDHAPDMYVSVDAKTASINRCNQTVADSLGYTKEEIIGRPIFELYHPDCMEDVQKAFNSFVQTGFVHDAELQLMRKDGSKIDVSLNVSSVRDDQGNILYSRSTWRDITDRKRVQAELDAAKSFLQNIIDSMPSILISIDDKGDIKHWNKEAEQFTGYTIESAIGKKFHKVFPFLAAVESRIRTAIESYELEKIGRLSYHQGSGLEYFDIMIYPLEGEDIKGAVVRVDNITERVRLEQIMSQTEKMMSVGGLAAGMAHELNNPLGGILQGLQNIRRRMSPDMERNVEVAEKLGLDLHKMGEYFKEREIEYFIQSIFEAGERASKIVENMLNFSRKPSMESVPTKISALIDRAVELASVDYDLKKKYDFRSITIEKDYDPNLPLVPCVGSEIQQVLLNLLRNSAQALCAHKESMETPCIKISTRTIAQGIAIDIKDNGPGIDSETIARVFEPFFTTRRPGEGTGLGLSVSYYIIHDEHGGSLEVNSEPGEGAAFTITLPLKKSIH